MTTSVPGASENPSSAAKPAEPLERVDSIESAASQGSFFGKVYRLLGGADGEGKPEEDGASPTEAMTAEKTAAPPPADPQVEGAEPSEPTSAAEASAPTCPACGSPFPDAGPCGDCGFVAAATPTAGQELTPLETGAVLCRRFEIVDHRGRREGVHIYLAKSLEDARAVIVHEAMADAAPPGAEQPSIADDSAAVSPPEQEDGSAESGATDAFFAGLSDSADAAPDGSQEKAPAAEVEPESPAEPAADGSAPAAAEPTADASAEASGEDASPPPPAPLCEILERERGILAQINYPTIPKVLDAWREQDRCYLALENLSGRSLREAWSDPQTRDAQRMDWLIQLCQSLAKLHAQGVIFNGISPERLSVDERGRLVLPDVLSAVKLPAGGASLAATRYTAPELVLAPESADARADLYSFGAAWYSLLAGRDLSDADFEAEFTPRLSEKLLAESHPLLIRLLLKTFARDPEARFPTEEERERGTPPTAELQRHLLSYKRCLAQLVLTLGSQTSVGVVRTANEDNYVAEPVRWKHGDESQEGALLVLADGMGGAAAGEVASEITVATVRDALAPQLRDWVDRSPDEQRRLASTAVGDAIRKAHDAVLSYCAEHPEAQGLACTVDAVVIVGSQAVIGHVGDSRVGKIRGEELAWITEDQTLVSRLLQLEMISEEEAETHPERSKLLQAIGGGKHVEPALYHAPLQPGDRLLVCSDGLTGHVDDARILEVVLASPTPQAAADRMVNEANLRGGTDNTTVILAAVR
jgi:PPM family protein phosphatase